jgi:Uma2 family endonuclease
MSAVPLPRCVTVEEYWAFDEKASVKTEYLNGRIYYQGTPVDPDAITDEELRAMAGAMPEHDRVTVNLIVALDKRVEGKPCEVHTSDQRIELTGTGQSVFPDITVSCGEPIYDMTIKPPVLENPLVVVEVLSPSTQHFDLNDKAEAYRQHDTIEDFLFISPYRVFVLHYARQDNVHWIVTEYNEMSQSVHLDSVDCNLPLTEIYRNFGF